MPHASEPELLVLHALAVKGVAGTDVVAAGVGLDAAAVEGLLSTHAEAGLVAWRDGRLPGWTLTTAGRTTHRRLLAAELAASGARDAVEAAYRSFLDVNGDLLAAATACRMDKEVSWVFCRSWVSGCSRSA